MEQAAGCTVSDLRVALTGTKLDVVDEITIDLRPGEVVGLVGESGSGKTTAGTALLVQPWGVLAPVIIIGVFTIGTNLMADGIAQLAGRGD